MARVREGVGKTVMTETPPGLRDGMDEKSSGDTLVAALELGVGSRIMAPKGIHVLIPKPVNVIFHGKRDLRIRLSQGSSDEEIILHYLSGSTIISRILIQERWRQKGQSQKRRYDDESRGQSNAGSGDLECKLEKAKTDSPLESPEGTQPCRPILDF